MNKHFLSNKQNILADGAFGTYFANLTNTSTPCEFANIDNKALVAQIHQEYISSGATLIRTNTFAANTFALQCPIQTIQEIIKAGCQIALEATNSDTLIFASIGPINADSEDVLEEYKTIADTFISCGAKYFLFETFGSLEQLPLVAKHIKDKSPDALICTSFAFSSDGYTRKGISINNIVDTIANDKNIDILGFNCGSGPAHLYNSLKNIPSINKTFSVMPNAGYAEKIHERTIFTTSPDYFGRMTADFRALGASIIGGCCGTTPEHIRSLSNYLKKSPIFAPPRILINEPKKHVIKTENTFAEKLLNGQFVIATELAPPYAPSAEKVIKNAQLLKNSGVDIITIADSPLARAGIDPVVLAAKIKREVGIDSLPHLCCRDRNITALKATILAGHMEGIRNILAVTGDPVPESDRGYIKGVFNTGSIGLIELISQLNSELLNQDKIYIGAALNVNALNTTSEVQRAERKLQNGASFFMTQPIFDANSLKMISQLRQKGAKVLGGIMPIVSYRNAIFLNNEIPGITVPQKYINQFTPDMPKEDSISLGIEIATDIIKQIKNEIDGLYFITPFNRGEIIQSIIERLKNTGIFAY